MVTVTIIVTRFYADNRRGMFSKEMINLAIQLISTWQVIAVTVVLVLFVFLINYVAKPHHQPLFVSKAKPKKAKSAAKAEKTDKKKSADEAINDELGLEED